MKIQLFKNFRSRKQVLDFTNMVFENLMTENPWEIEYNEDEYLNLGAEYIENGQDLRTEINILETNSEDDEEHIEDIELEAKYVANKIKELINSKFQVYDAKKQEFRTIKYKDIAILLRATKLPAPIFEKELAKRNIPVFSDSSNTYLESIEIQTIINLLKIIDNPLQDIPLVTVLRSYIGGFTDNDLIKIRLNDKYDNFYNTMLKAKMTAEKDLKEKIENFLNNIENWRKAKEYLSLDELIWKIYSDTGYYNYVALMPNGELRQANLKMLFERAHQYEKASFKGLFNFMNFIEKVHSGSKDLSSAKIIGENEDVVRIMSIHKSKGLEFPIVFLSNTGKQINLMDLKDDILLHNQIGIGTKYIDYEKQIEYDTLTKSAVSNKLHLETIAEEMRILYVALTRAKEKLIITGTIKNVQEEIDKMDDLISRYQKNGNKINPILIKKYKKYMDWIVLVYKYNQDKLKEDCDLNIIHKNQIEIEEKLKPENIESKLERLEKSNINEDDFRKITQMLEYQYKDAILSEIPTKISVSKLKESAFEENKTIDIEEIMNQSNKTKENLVDKPKETFSKPKFLQAEENSITNAKKGTLIHLCMQNLDFKEDYSKENVKELIEKLESKNKISKEEADNINIGKIYNFTQNKIWQRIKEAKAIEKEKAFYINIPISKIYKDLQYQELEGDILVQGIIDLYFVDKDDKLVLMDYKTDYVQADGEKELVKKYEIQLKLYKQALEQALGRNVDEIYIYSTYLDKLIDVNL